MKKYNVIILGTDISCYSLARSYYEAFGKKAIVCAQSILKPFVDTKIADIYLKDDFATTAKSDDAFVEHLNNVVKENPAETNIIFLPYEEYLNKLLRNLDRLNFDLKIPYPDKKMAYNLIHKSEFYKFLDKIGVNYPKTQVVSKENIDSLTLKAPVFAKPDNFEEFTELAKIDDQRKGYKFDSIEDCKNLIKKVYTTKYSSKMVVQEYINGGDGSEFTLNGYRSADGKLYMSLCRDLLSDHRKMWVGNHILQVDHEDDRLYNIAKKIVDALNYHGLFNIDFKIDTITGKIYVFEVNVRQGRSFYFSTLSGVNVVEAAVNDLVFNNMEDKRPTKKFMLRALSLQRSRENVDKKFKDIFEQRADISLNPMENKDDNSEKRNYYVNLSIKNLEKEIYG